MMTSSIGTQPLGRSYEDCAAGTAIYGGTFSEVAGDQILINYNYDQSNKVEKWFSPTDYGRIQASHFGKRVGQTGDWFLECQEFRDWVSVPDRQILWCPGIPGVGKTMLASVAIDHLLSIRSEANGIAVSYVYCNYQTKNHSPTHVLRGIARQIWRSSPTSRSSLDMLYNKLSNSSSQPTLSQLCDAIKECIRPFQTIYIVLDALDEYLGHHQNTDGAMSDLITTLLSLGRNVKLLVTGRRIGDMDRIMGDFGSMVLEIQEAVEADLQQYIALRAHNELPFCIENELLFKIVARVADAASGRFITAELHMNSITKRLTPGEVEDALDRLTDNLDQVYEATVKRIRDQDDMRKDLAHRVLCWLSTSLRPMSLGELRHALAAAPGRTNLQKYLHTGSTITSVCAGLVYIDESTDWVQFVHLTTYEFFRARSKEFLPDANMIIATTCIHYLSIPSLNDCQIIPNLRKVHDEPTRLELVHGNHLLDYAARNWGHHARECEVDISDTVHSFLSNRELGSVAFSYLVLCALYEIDSAEGDVAGLMMAVFFDLPHSFGRLMGGGANVNSTTLKQMRTPLMFAIEANKPSIVRLIVKNKDLDLNIRDATGKTALSLAASQTQEEVFSLLLSRGKKNKKRPSPLPTSPSQRIGPRVFQTLNGNRSLNMLDGPRSPDLLDGSPLVNRLAVRTWGVLVEDEEDNKQRTPLSYASADGNRLVVGRLLRRNDVRVNLRDAQGRTPLSYASERGHHRIVKRLLKHMAREVEIPDNKGRTPLMYAAMNNHGLVVKTFINSGWQEWVLFEARDEKGRNALSYAAEGASEAVVRDLLAIERAPEVRETSLGELLAINQAHSQDSIGHTPLSYAVLKGRTDVVRTLLENYSVKRRINFPDKNGRPPFTHAVIGGHLDIVKIFILQGRLKPDHKDAVGRTPLSYAAQDGNYPIVRCLLVKTSVDVNTADREGRTSLSYAAEHGHLDVVKALLKRKDIEIDLKDKRGRDARYYARQKGHRSIKRLLRRRRQSWNKDVQDIGEGKPVFEWLDRESLHFSLPR